MNQSHQVFDVLTKEERAALQAFRKRLNDAEDEELAVIDDIITKLMPSGTDGMVRSLAASVSKHCPSALFCVVNERLAQNEKWGESNHDPFCWMTTLMEEVGELARSAMHMKFGGKAESRYHDEAIQVAAVAVAMAECFRRDEWHWGQADKTEKDEPCES